VTRSRWIADIAPGWEVAVLILKDPVEDQELFAAGVHVGEKWLSGA
jgi:hypothetical protein